MWQMPIAPLPDRAVIEIGGADRVLFLQGLVSNDVTAVAPGQAVFAALLTPQGKYVADFFLYADAEHLLLETQASGAAALVGRLARYRLRAAVTLALAPAWLVFAGWGAARLPDQAVAAPDPRQAAAGWRALTQAALACDGSPDAYDLHRLALGLPNGPPDLDPDKTVLMEAGFDALGGISWTKGCYMGQELTARTRYRGLIKRRLVRLRLTDGPLPPPGTALFDAGGAEIGTVRSGRDGIALGTLRLEALAAGGSWHAGASLFRCGEPLVSGEPAIEV